MIEAAGPGVAVVLHGMYERGGPAVVDGFPGGPAWRAGLEEIDEAHRHLATHEGHLVELTPRDRAGLEGGLSELIGSFTLTGSAAEVARAHRGASGPRASPSWRTSRADRTSPASWRRSPRPRGSSSGSAARETQRGAVTARGHTERMATGGWRSRALWRTRPYLAPYRRHITFIVISSIVSSAGMVAVPLIVKQVIDGPLADGDRAGDRPLGGAHGRHRRWSRCSSPSAAATCSPCCPRAWRPSLRDDLYAQLQRLDVGFHDRWQSGQLLSRAMTDLSVIRRFVGFGAIFFVLILVQVAAIFGVLARAARRRSPCSPSRPRSPCSSCATASSCGTWRSSGASRTRPATSRPPSRRAPRASASSRPSGGATWPSPATRPRPSEIHDTQMERITLHTRFVWVLGADPQPHAHAGAARRACWRSAPAGSRSAGSSPSCPTC